MENEQELNTEKPMTMDDFKTVFDSVMRAFIEDMIEVGTDNLATNTDITTAIGFGVEAMGHCLKPEYFPAWKQSYHDTMKTLFNSERSEPTASAVPKSKLIVL